MHSNICVFILLRFRWTSALEISTPPHVSGVGLQTFKWQDLTFRDGFFKYIRGRTQEFVDAGFSHVWLPPATSSLDSQGYQPLEWYSIVGDKDFRAANSALKKSGVVPVCDVVLNHRVGKYIDPCNGNFIRFENPTWNSSVVVSEDWKCDNPQNCDAYCFAPCPCGNKDSGQNYVAAPDLDHTNPIVQNGAANFLRFLQDDYDCEGFRFDMAGGYDGTFLRKYMEATTAKFGIGEFLSLDAVEMAAWVRKSGYSAFDYPGRFALKNALDDQTFDKLSSFGKMPGLAGFTQSGASTFLDNHDTLNPDCPVGDGGFSDKILMSGYAYILTHPPFPWVLREHFDTSHKSEILKLMAIRARAGVTSADRVGTIFVSPDQHDLYAAYIGGDPNDCSGKLAVKLGPRSWWPCGNGWTLAASGGSGWAVWERDHFSTIYQ